MILEEMVAIAPTDTPQVKPITDAQLIALHANLEDGQYIEVEDGEITLQEKKMTWTHTLIIRAIFRFLDAYVLAHQLGQVLPDGARYVLVGIKTDIKRTSQPDLSFVRQTRIPADFDWDGDFYGAPDFAVEVISRGQSNKTLTQKVYHYLDAGTEEVWFINPVKKTITQYRANETEPRVYTGDEVIVTPLFPELNIITSAVFAK